MEGDDSQGGGEKSPWQSCSSVRREVVIQRAVRDVGGSNWSVLTRTNYDEWSMTMKVKLRVRRLWKAVDQGTEDEEEDCSALEAILAAVPPVYRSGTVRVKGLREGSLGHLKAMRVK